MKLFFESFVILLLTSSASAKLREEKLFNEATAGAHSDGGQERPKFGITHCANRNERIDNEYILDVAKNVKIRAVMDIFKLNFPHGKITHKYKQALHGFSMSGVTEDEILLFADGCNNMIVEIQENAKAHKSIEWGLDRIDDRVDLDGTFLPNSTGLDGAGVSIYIIDTGVKTSHNEFKGRITLGRDFTEEGQFDGDGHGTHVAGIAAGKTYDVAKKATIVPVKVLNSNGEGSYADIIAGIDWVIGEHKKSPTKRSVANLSLGGEKSTALNSAIARAAAAGIVMVVAAGNDNKDACTTSPASEPSAITVGSSANNDSRSSFSNFGACVDIFAPGSDIKSAGISRNSATDVMSGTSMASPHVAGAAALVLQSDSTIKGSDVQGILINKATPNALKDVRKKSPNKADIGSSTPPPPPPLPPTATGKVTFKIVYDAYHTETQWNLWQKIGNDWSLTPLADYGPPAANIKERIVTRQFADGYYSFDIHDSWGDGLEVPGSFTVTAFDTQTVLQQGGPGSFVWSYSVEFEVKDGVVIKKWSGAFTR